LSLRFTDEFNSFGETFCLHSFSMLQWEELPNDYIIILALLEQVEGLMIAFEVDLANAKLFNLPLKFMDLSNVLNSVIKGYIFVQRSETLN